VPPVVAHLPYHPPTLLIQQPVQQSHPGPAPLLYHPPGFMAVQQCGPWPVLSQPLPLPGALVQQQGGYQQQGGHPQPGLFQGWVGQPSDQSPYQPVAQHHHHVYQYGYQQRDGFQQQGGYQQQGGFHQQLGFYQRWVSQPGSQPSGTEGDQTAVEKNPRSQILIHTNLIFGGLWFESKKHITI